MKNFNLLLFLEKLFYTVKLFRYVIQGVFFGLVGFGMVIMASNYAYGFVVLGVIGGSAIVLNAYLEKKRFIDTRFKIDIIHSHYRELAMRRHNPPSKKQPIP